ncbi:MAG: tetratricopeptide repeat protein, partial [Thermoleophilia bacterium]|nr:tetratricopeptide repeat protein [Thermoleophilia bacterium]
MLRRTTISITLALYLSATVGCSTDPEARKQRLLAAGNKYFEQGKYTEASIIYRRAIQQDRRFGEAYYRLGLTYLKLGQPQQAAGAFRRAIELQPGNADAYGQLIDLYLAAYLANPEEQKPLLTELQTYVAQLEQHVPGSVAAHRARGFVALAQKDYQTAIAELKVAVEREPDDVKAQVGLAEALAASGQWAEAESRARQFIQQHPDQAPMYDFLYLQYVLRQQYDQAEAILQQKCANNPKELAYRM